MRNGNGWWSDGGALLSRRRKVRRKGIGIGRKPSVGMALKAGELILPNTDLRASGKLAGGEQVDDVPRADLGRPKVKSELTTVGKVMVLRAPSHGERHGAQTSKAIEVGNVGKRPRDEEEGRLVRAGGARQAVGKINRVLDGEGVE